jgi:hypothetical protein
MNEITLTWTENRSVKTQTIQDQQIGKYPGTVRIGRDPARCDIILPEPTVSGLHVEIFFNQQQGCFFLRNLRESNPPMVDGKNIIKGEAPLRQGSTIYLGQMELTVLAVTLAPNGIPATIVMPQYQGRGINQPLVPVVPTYGLQCPNHKCGKSSPYALLNSGCPWCGTSLAAAASILMAPTSP